MRTRLHPECVTGMPSWAFALWWRAEPSLALGLDFCSELVLPVQPSRPVCCVAGRMSLALSESQCPQERLVASVLADYREQWRWLWGSPWPQYPRLRAFLSVCLRGLSRWVELLEMRAGGGGPCVPVPPRSWQRGPQWVNVRGLRRQNQGPVTPSRALWARGRRLERSGDSPGLGHTWFWADGPSLARLLDPWDSLRT